MELLERAANALAWASRKLGLETADRFPPGHAYARTRWNKAYFDIPSDLAPDAIERRMVDAIVATPSVFAHIECPTPRMQRALIDTIRARLRSSCQPPLDLAAMLLAAYANPHTREVLPGLRARLQELSAADPASQARALLDYLQRSPDASSVIEA